MKLRDLKHGEKDVASSWPPQWGGWGAAPPVGEMGKLTKVEKSKIRRGVIIHIEYDGRAFSGLMEWNGEKPTAEKVIDVMNRYAGKYLKDLGNLDLD